MTRPVLHSGNWAMKCYSEIMKREEVGCWPGLLRLVSGFRVLRSWGLSDASLWASSGVGAAELRAGPAVVRCARQSKAFLCRLVLWSEGCLRESPSLQWMRGVQFRVPGSNPHPFLFTLRQLWLRGPRPWKPSCAWAVCGRRASPVEGLLVWRSGFPLCGSETSSPRGLVHTRPCPPQPFLRPGHTVKGRQHVLLRATVACLPTAHSTCSVT